MQIPTYCEKLIRQMNNEHYSLENMRRMLEDENWITECPAGMPVYKKYLKETPEKVRVFYRMQGYLDAVRNFSAAPYMHGNIIAPKEEKMLTDELTAELSETIEQTVHDTIRRFFTQRNQDNENYDTDPKSKRFHNP